MHKTCPICGEPRSFGDYHQYLHSKYQLLFRSNVNRTPRDDIDIAITSYLDKNLSYTQIGKILGVSRQRIGQRVARMGIYRDKTKAHPKWE